MVSWMVVVLVDRREPSMAGLMVVVLELRMAGSMVALLVDRREPILKD